MASGVTVDQDCKDRFEQVKKDKIHRYVIFKIKDGTIVVESVGDRGNSYDDFLRDLQKEGENICRYGLYDYEYEHQCQGATDTSHKQKLFLMMYCPDNGKLKDKLLYASSFQYLKSAFVGIQSFIQATDQSEVALDSVDKQLRAMDRS